jgi:hypothetical protein
MIISKEPGSDEFYDDYCYECTGYGDDYSFDSEAGEYVRNCDDCPYNDRDPGD